MDGVSGSSLWQRISSFFQSKSSSESVEKAILEAEEDGELLADEKSMLLRVLRLDELTVQDVMTPITDFVSASATNDLAEVVKVIVDSGHSRIPIFENSKDNIIGITYAKDLIKYWYDESMRDSPIRSVMREPFFVPETKRVLDLLHEFRVRKTHMAMLLDEHGNIAGLVTIEDVIEQIIGDIEDEHDCPKEDDIKVLDSKHLIISGRVTLEDLAEGIGLLLESEEVDTIGGYLCEFAGRVPSIGDTFEIEGVRFKISDADTKQVRSIELEVSGNKSLRLPVELF